MNSELPVPERVLCDLLYRHWRMTVEGGPPNERFVAYRPIGWQGEGDPFERISAPTRTELLRLMAHRHLGVNQALPHTSINTATTAPEPEPGSKPPTVT